MNERAPISPDRSIHVLALLFVAAALFLGSVKVALQKRSPPAWAAAPIHGFEGYVSIDGFSQRAAFLRDSVTGGEAREEPEADLSLHPTSWLVPLAVAATSFLTGSIPIAFAILSGLASLAQVLLVGLLARRFDAERRAEVGWLAALATGGHCLTMRTAAQLTLDPFCAVWITASLLLSLRWSERRRGSDLLWLSLLGTSGLFLKSSFLPALALPSLVAWLAGERGAKRLLGSFFLTALLPLAIALAFQRALLPETSATGDLEHLAAAWKLDSTQIAHFALEMALLFQLYPLALLGTWRDRPARSGLVALGLLLASTWAFGLPAVPRLYLPALGVLVALAVPRIHVALGPRATLRLLAVSGLFNLGIAAAGL